MAGGYDGSIRINTQINTAPLNNAFDLMENKVKGIAATIGVAFGAKELLSFGSNAIAAASDLQEAQNVVDTAFGEMSYKMEQFADTSLEIYGISELTAKNMGSTYMAMAKGMGVATDAASDMAVTLTGRLSDIMSFYNKTATEVDTIGRALITGETEPLKAIGVVMTQTNLQAYAMAQGLNKAYTEMSAQEQLLVRYKYFLEQTSMAQGDFAKTSDGWANQTRLLTERTNAFMTNFGEILMNTFTPALQFANEAVSFLNELMFGGSAEETTAAHNAAAITSEVEDIGTAAEKSEKKLNNLLSGFDELHIISGAKSSEEENSAEAGIDTSNLLGVDLEKDSAKAKKAANKYREIINEIYLAFKRHPLTKLIEEIIGDIGEFFDIIDENGDINYGGIVTTLETLFGAFIAYKGLSTAVGGIEKFSGAFSGLIGMIVKHPAGAIAVGVVALATGLVLLDDELKRQEIASHFGDISISLEELDELTNPITQDIDKIASAFSERQGKIAAARDAFTELSESVDATLTSLEKGAKSDKNIGDQIDSWIDSALELTGLELDTSAMESLFVSDGDISEQEQYLLDNFDELNSSIAGKIELIRSQIHTITQTAADENRALMEDELQNIRDLYNEIAEMTALNQDIKTEAAWERLINRAYSYDSYDVILQELTAAREQSEKSIAKIETAAYEQLMTELRYAELAGKSKSEIAVLKEDGIKAIEKAVEESQQKSLLYEQRLLNAWGEAHFGFTEDEMLADALKGYRAVEQEKIKKYYALLKEMQSLGSSNEDVQAVMQTAQQLGDDMYIRIAQGIAQDIANADETYVAWVNELAEVSKSLEGTGYDTGDGYIDELVAAIENPTNGAEISSALAKIIDGEGIGTKTGSEILTAIQDYLNVGFEGDGFMFNSSAAEKYFAENYGNNNYNASYVPVFEGGKASIDINLYINGENVAGETSLVGQHKAMSYNIDRTTVNNGKYFR